MDAIKVRGLTKKYKTNETKSTIESTILIFLCTCLQFMSLSVSRI